MNIHTTVLADQIMEIVLSLACIIAFSLQLFVKCKSPKTKLTVEIERSYFSQLGDDVDGVIRKSPLTSDEYPPQIIVDLKSSFQGNPNENPRRGRNLHQFFRSSGLMCSVMLFIKAIDPFCQHIYTSTPERCFTPLVITTYVSAILVCAIVAWVYVILGDVYSHLRASPPPNLSIVFPILCLFTLLSTTVFDILAILYDRNLYLTVNLMFMLMEVIVVLAIVQRSYFRVRRTLWGPTPASLRSKTFWVTLASFFFTGLVIFIGVHDLRDYKEVFYQDPNEPINYVHNIIEYLQWGGLAVLLMHSWLPFSNIFAKPYEEPLMSCGSDDENLVWTSSLEHDFSGTPKLDHSPSPPKQCVKTLSPPEADVVSNGSVQEFNWEAIAAEYNVKFAGSEKTPTPATSTIKKFQYREDRVESHGSDIIGWSKSKFSSFSGLSDKRARSAGTKRGYNLIRTKAYTKMIAQTVPV